MQKRNSLLLETEMAESQLFEPRPILGKDLSPNLPPDEIFYSDEDIWEEFDRLLLAHYGEPIRKLLNASRAQDGWKPL